MHLSTNGCGCRWNVYFIVTRQKSHILKGILVTLLIASIQVKGFSFNQGSINISMKNAPLSKIFATIQKQSEFTFIYERETIRKAKPVDINVTNASIAEVLEICFKDQALSYVMD